MSGAFPFFVHPATPSGMRGYLTTIPDGDAGVYTTLETMRAMAQRDSVTPDVRAAASGAVRGIPFDRENWHAHTLRRWIEARTYFLADPVYAEALHDPAWQIRQILTRGMIGLDCDDIAMLAAAMGLSIGLKARFVVVGFSSPRAPFRHVWTDLQSMRSPSWVSIDPTRALQGLDRAPIGRVAYLEV